MKPISIEDRDLIISKNEQIYNSEYQFSTLFIWQATFDFMLEIINDTILIFGHQHNGDLQCYFPLGPEKELTEALYEAIDIFHAENQLVNFRPLNQRMKDKITELLPFQYTSGSKESYSDYIYDFKKIRSFDGHEYKHKRKEWRTFNTSYNYTYETITPDNNTECLVALQNMVIADLTPDPEEIRAYNRALTYLDRLFLRGGLIRIDGMVEAVAVGEAIGDMVLMHIRRANKKYKGIYPSMIKLFLENEFCDRDYLIVNTQDDLGIQNIREAKMSYNPIYLLKKYFVKEKKSQ